jgi:hypothetical protein
MERHGQVGVDEGSVNLRYRDTRGENGACNVGVKGQVVAAMQLPSPLATHSATQFPRARQL